MKRQFKITLATCTILVFVATTEKARAITITQVASPTQLNGPLTVEDFEDDTFVPGVTFSANSGIRRGTSNDFSGGVTTSGSWGLSTNDYPNPISMTFNLGQPAKSVGMFFGNDDTCCSGGFTSNLDVYGTSGLLGTIGVQANMNDWVDQFLGFNSDTPVTSVTLRYGSGSDVGLYHFIDDFQFSTVPEPNGLASVMWAGAAAVAFVRRKEKGVDAPS